MDIRFIKQIYRTSAFAWLFALAVCGALGSAPAAIGLTVGVFISLTSLALVERVVTAVFVPASVARPRRAVRKVLAVAILKYALFGIVLWVALRSQRASPVGIVMGVALPHAVIFLKAVGMTLFKGTEANGRL